MSDKRHIGGLARLKPVGFAALCLTVLFVAGAPQALAGDDINCSCVANGQRIELGKLFCIKTASGKEFLARCERVLNNTSWKRVQDSCPMALDLSTPTDRPVL